MLVRWIPTQIHGVIDYLVGIALIAAPWIFGFSENTAATLVPVVLGAGIILYSLLTQYELGVIKWIRMPVHLWLDLLGGLVLLVSPWLFGFAEDVWIPHVVVGAAEIMVALITSPVPGYEDRREIRP